MQRLDALGFPISQELGTDLVFASPPWSHNGFIMNYNMNRMDKTMGELFTILKTTESGIQKDTNHVMMENKTTNFKNKGKPKKKGKSMGDSKTGMPRKSKIGATSNVECFFYKEKGHWKINCKKYLVEKKSGKSISGMSVIHVIDVFLTGPHCNSWVLDIGSVANICILMQELQSPK
jgi:hypothetical protein